MDLRDLVARMRRLIPDNAIVTFEDGRAVRRTFATAYEDVYAARTRLAAWGIKAGMRVGIRAPNCYEWIIHDLALIDLRAPSVAFTDDFAGWAPGALCEKYHLELLLDGGPAPGPGEAPSFLAHLRGENTGVQAIGRGPAAADPDFERPGFFFSSGSSGGLKGMILNRRGVEACVDAFTQAVVPRRDDRLLLFLPMSNYQQRLMCYSAFWYGFDLIITDPAHLFRALQELAPTVLIAPPALYEAFETRFDNLPGWKRGAARTLGRIARAIPARALREKLGRMVFRQAHDALGGHMRFMVTGMAPIKRSTLELCSLMQLPLFETYGLIESGSVALNLPGASRLGSVGKLLPGVRVDFASDGEILVRRKHPIAVGYFECADGESECTFVGDAVATGDIGRFDEDGYLHLIGRKKEIIVTSGGEKVHPEIIEAEIAACPEVARAVVFGRRSALSLAAVILPKRSDDAAMRARVRQFIDGLNERWRHLTVGTVVFTDIVFSRENGFLRPNLKIDRKRVGDYFQAEIEGGSDRG